jgi:hypothetical protein
MSFSTPTPADRLAALRTAPMADQAGLRVPAVLDALLLALLAALLGRPARIACIRHPAPDSPTSPAAPLPIRLPTDGTHLVIASPLLYVIGPGPNRGMRPHARPTPRPRPRSARAPPPSPSKESTPLPGPRTHAPIITI